MSIIGLLYGFIFLRYGLIPLIEAHYLFDVFWGLAAYILKPSSVYLFGGSALVLALPFLFAGLTFFMNRQEKERPLAAILDETQQYNLGILIAYVTAKKSQGLLAQDISRELTSHNWDRDLVEIAVGQVFKTGGA